MQTVEWTAHIGYGAWVSHPSEWGPWTQPWVRGSVGPQWCLGEGLCLHLALLEVKSMLPSRRWGLVRTQSPAFPPLDQPARQPRDKHTQTPALTQNKAKLGNYAMFYRCTWRHQTLRLVEWTKERKRHKHRNRVSISTSRTKLIISRGTYFFPDQSRCLPNMPGLGHMNTGYIISWNQTAGRCSLSCSQVLLFVMRTRSPTSESSSLLI